MPTRKKILFLLLILASCAGDVRLMAQDLHFSQFYEAPLLRNPSLAGLFEGDVRVQTVYRSQWNSVAFPYQTGSVNADYKFSVGKGDDFMTAGVQTMFDRAGTLALSTIQMMPAVNFHKSLSQTRSSYLSLGFMGGPVSRSLDRSKITTNNQFDGFAYNGSLPDGEVFSSNYTYLDLNVGMSYNTTVGAQGQHLFFVGLAYHHFNKPVNSFYRNITHLPKWVLSGGFKLNMNPWSYITFTGDYTRQYPYQEFVAGAMYSRKIGDDDVPTYTIHGGLYMRYKDAVIPVIKLDWRPFSLAFSYDVNISSLAVASAGRGGVEVSLSYIAFVNKDNSTRDKVKCPKF
jgi:type IX secretion system PorP/SprF family membrane protein